MATFASARRSAGLCFTASVRRWKVIYHPFSCTSACSSNIRKNETGGQRGRRRKRRIPWPRVKAEDLNQNAPWSSVFQTAKPYDPFTIPLPIRMGRSETGIAPPSSLGNLELMKIPNFFHLTPPAISEHCKALKPLCTPWPENLPLLPLKLETRNYVFSGHSIRHPGSRKVSLKVNLKDLTLTKHARDKLIRLAGSRYDSKTNVITLVGKRCPTRRQNRDYVTYLLKVLYLESNKVEPWEKSESEELKESDRLL